MLSNAGLPLREASAGVLVLGPQILELSVVYLALTATSVLFSVCQVIARAHTLDEIRERQNGRSDR